MDTTKLTLFRLQFLKWNPLNNKLIKTESPLMRSKAIIGERRSNSLCKIFLNFLTAYEAFEH